MSSYVISCCSTADLTEEHFSKREISYICFHYKLNDTEYADDLGKSMPFDQFYAGCFAVGRVQQPVQPVVGELVAADGAFIPCLPSHAADAVIVFGCCKTNSA